MKPFLTTDDSENFASAFSVNYVADGAASTNALVYSLGVKATGVDSGVVDTATGQSVYIYLEGGIVVGRVGVVRFSGRQQVRKRLKSV